MWGASKSAPSESFGTRTLLAQPGMDEVCRHLSVERATVTLEDAAELTTASWRDADMNEAEAADAYAWALQQECLS